MMECQPKTQFRPLWVVNFQLWGHRLLQVFVDVCKHNSPNGLMILEMFSSGASSPQQLPKEPTLSNQLRKFAE